MRLALVLLGAFFSSGSASNASKPHIIMFVVDDLGWHNVGWHNPDMITPHSNKLVKEGVELSRSYVYFYCAPTRSSIMSGRLPYHVNQIIMPDWSKDWNMPQEMTAMPKKLKQAGYHTHMVGKWHVGYQTAGQTPHGHGFDTSFGYFAGAEDHWTQASCVDPVCNVPSNNKSWAVSYLAAEPLRWHQNSLDLWCTDKPCFGRTGSDYHMGRNGQVVGDIDHYGDNMYTKEALRIIDAHNPEEPLFFYIAFQSNHEPLQAPDEFIEMYPEDWRSDRRWYAGMTSYWDACVGNITAKIVEKGMWNDTLIVLTTDNGGPTYWRTPLQFPPFMHYEHGGGANNWPLRGSKISAWEGGMRGVSFASGGFLPQRVRGTKLEEYIHVTDWYATFSYLAGLDSTDPKTEGYRSDGTRFPLPPVDSINMWPLISGEVKVSPRQEIPLSVEHPLFNVSAIISGDYKLLLGEQTLSFWQGPEFPNGTAPYGENHGPKLDCGDAMTYEGGCLYNIREDPAETVNLAEAKPDVVARLRNRIKELAKTKLNQADVVAKDAKCAISIHLPGLDSKNCPAPREFVDVVRKNQGFVGPWMDKNLDTVV